MSNPHLDTSISSVPIARPAPHGVPPPLVAALAAGLPVPVDELVRRAGGDARLVAAEIAELRAAGLDIVADGSGYRLMPPLDLLDASALRAALPAFVRERLGALENHWRVDSTSSELARRLAGLPDRSFVFADWQQAGRGRRGRAWISPPGSGLQVSCLKRFGGGYAALSGLSLVVGIAVAEALEACGARDVRLKWPNDLVLGDAKLGGILVELGGDAEGPCHAIIGVGINCALPAMARARLARPCADLTAACAGHPPTRTRLATALVERLVTTLDAFAQSGFAAYAVAFAGRDALAGRDVHVRGARRTFAGVAAGVDARGALQVRGADGVYSVDSAEVSVRAA